MSGRVLVLNSGSSSIKYRLFDAAMRPLAAGLVERIGESSGRCLHRVAGTDGQLPDDGRIVEGEIPDHVAGLAAIEDALATAGLDEGLTAIGHRVVHGGAEFREPAIVDDAVLARIRAQVPLAPLHNPANLTAIEVARRLRPTLDQVAVFDTAFHATLPEHAYRYAIPEDVYATHGVRRYGFHGTSHGYVAKRAAAALARPIEQLALVTLHLGNGASVAAIDGGRCVETSMGLSPLEGLVMGTRCGDLDPAIVFHLVREAGMAPEQIETMLNRSSGLVGLCGDNDVRVIEARAAEGDADAERALAVYAHRIRKYLGAYTAILGRLDAVVFTAGVGENAAGVRRRVCADLAVLGIELDETRNHDAGASRVADGVRAIHADGSAVQVLVVATDEEREIAEQTLAALAGAGVGDGG